MKVLSFWVSSVLLISFCLLSCSDNGNKNPAGPGKNSYTISGDIKPRFHSMATDTIWDVSVIVIGEDSETTAYTDSTGLFNVDNLQQGNYTVTPSKDGFFFLPKIRMVTVEDKNEIIPTISMVKEGHPIFGDYPILIIVKVTDPESTGIQGVTFNITGDYEGTSGTNNLGYCYFAVKIDSTYAITPVKEGYDYSFEPENLVILFDEYSEYSATYEFKANNTGPPLHSISGCIVGPIDEFNFLRVEIREKGTTIYTTYADSIGVYSFNGLKDGTYTLYYDGGDYRTYNLDPRIVTVTIDGEDVVASDVTATVTGDFTPTIYNLTGRVVDEHGMGIPDTEIAVYAINSDYHYDRITSDEDGIYTREIQIGKKGLSIDSETFVVIPHKDGFTFSPEDTTLTLSRSDNVEHGGVINAPLFTGHDHTRISSSDYFPLIIGTSWIYQRTVDDGESNDITVKVIDKDNNGGRMYHLLSKPGPWKFTDFRIEDNSVFAFSDDDEVLFLKFGVVPGTQWESDTIAGTYTRTGAFLGIETVETPAGTFENCAHFESKVVYGETSYDSYDLWYAPGVGLVRSVKIVENYGRRLEYVVDELKSFLIP